MAVVDFEECNRDTLLTVNGVFVKKVYSKQYTICYNRRYSAASLMALGTDYHS